MEEIFEQMDVSSVRKEVERMQRFSPSSQMA